MTEVRNDTDLPSDLHHLPKSSRSYLRTTELQQSRTEVAKAGR